MDGYVSAHHALINITFHLPHKPDFDIEYVIDTGFVGYLTLPLNVIQIMELPFIRRMPANLADNSTIFVEVYAATFFWNGELREEEVLATGIRPLAGTLLLNGTNLNVQFSEGGLVGIDML